MKQYHVEVCNGRRTHGISFAIAANNIASAIKKASRAAAQDPYVLKKLENWYVDQVLGKPTQPYGSRLILWDAWNGRLQQSK